MTPSRLEDYLDHIVESAKLARSYVERMSKEDFLVS